MHPPYRFYPCQRIHHTDDAFSVVSFNILSQTCLEQHQSDRYARDGNPEYHVWGFRMSRIVNLLAKMLPSIICLQEVDLDPIIIRDLEKQFLQEGYHMILQDPKKSSHLPLFVTAILFLADEFELLWHESRSRVLLAELLWKKQSESVYIGNMHLQANPDKANVRLRQTQKALHRLELHMAESGHDLHNSPVVLCGDFNDEDDSVVSHLLHGKLEDHHQFDFEDIEHFMRRFCTTEADRKTFPSYFSKTSSCELDFIFYTRTNLVPLGALHVFKEESDLEQIVTDPPPNQLWPSDHTPIGCIFSHRAHDVIMPINQ